MVYNKGKRWTDDEEEILIGLLKNNNPIDECSNVIGRTQLAIKIRIEEIIYKKLIYDNQNNNELEYLKDHVDLTIEEIIKKYRNKYKNKIEKKYKKIILNLFT